MLGVWVYGPINTQNELGQEILSTVFLSFLVILHLPLIFATKSSFRGQENIKGIVIQYTFLTALVSIGGNWRSFPLVTVYWTTESSAFWDYAEPVSLPRLLIIDQVTSKVHFMFRNLH